MEASTAGLLTVDLGAVVANWRDLATRYASGTPQLGETAAVVKADGYGLGAGPIARALAGADCRHFFVAHEAEGLALRAALGPGPMIAVLNGFPPGGEAAAAGLVPVLNGLPDVEAHAAAASRAGRKAPAILHLDTGMGRLGLDAGEQAALEAAPSRRDGLDLLYVMTHLACADEPDAAMNRLQAGRFAAAAARLAPCVRRSLANSSGIFLGPDFASDLARPGCALYGVNPTPGHPNPMRLAARLEAPVLQLRDIPAGATVGYGAAWKATRPTRIATVAAGYADGFLRALSGQGGGQGLAGLLDGRPVPLVGRVSMDLTTFDVTDLPEGLVRPGAMITLMGDAPGLTPDALAARAGTIGYEILTALGARYRRVYLPAPGEADAARPQGTTLA